MDFDLKQLLENAGVSLPNENSLGEKIIPDDDPVKLQNFWNWFGDSKVVDEQGRPLVVYHGTTKHFDVFDKNKIGNREIGYYGSGFYFTPDKDTAKSYYTKTKSGYYSKSGNVKKCYLSIKNPYIIEDYLSAFSFNKNGYVERDGNNKPKLNKEFLLKMEQIDKSIYDGKIILDSYKNMYEIIVFEPNQIKSINNKGTFSSASNNIYETVAYHGTPQKFDEFSLKYIGKGEGHHFYGWGLYFAEDINSAYNFNKMRTDGNPDWVLPNSSPVTVLRFDDDDKLVKQGVQFPNEAEAIGKYGEKAVDDLIEKYQDYIDRGSDRRSDIACLDFLKSIKGKLISGKGAVYQVEIPDDEYLMIWENRIFGETSRNSKYIQNCLKKMFEDLFPEYTDHLYDMTGADVYQDIAGWIGDKRNMDIKKAAQTYDSWQEYTLKTYQLTSMLLLKYGVKGIKYEKDGTNYVIFNPKDVHIQGDTRALWG